MAIVGQAFTVCLVHFSLEFPLPLLPLFGAIALSALINVVLALSFSADHPADRAQRRAAARLRHPAAELPSGADRRAAEPVLDPAAGAGDAVGHHPVAAHDRRAVRPGDRRGQRPGAVSDRSAVDAAAGLRLPRLYMLATWCALVLGTALIAGYAWRVADEARRMSRGPCGDPDGAGARAAALGAWRPGRGGRARARQPARDHRRDRARARQQHPAGQPADRGRRRAGQPEPALPRDPQDRSASRAAATSPRRSPACRCRACSRRWRSPSGGSSVAPRRAWSRATPALEPTLTPTPELKHALANLIDNAVGFAERRVRIVVGLSSDLVVVRIEDDGPGFSPEVLELLGEPYVSSRPSAVVWASACSSRRPCLREPAQRCNLAILAEVPG